MFTSKSLRDLNTRVDWCMTEVAHKSAAGLSFKLRQDDLWLSFNKQDLVYRKQQIRSYNTGRI